MAVDAEEAGMDAFMDKPFKLEEITAVYIKLLERETQSTPSVDTAPLHGVVAHGPRSIYNVTKNAKIFIDASELDEMIASQIIGDSMSLEGTSLTTAVAVSTEWETVKNAQNESDRGNGVIGGIKHNNIAKVHAEN